uniref:ArnT family glycosyltransferase n=1 Tax=Veillonella magna TaxID=464322 RepID=UPI00402A8CA4
LFLVSLCSFVFAFLALREYSVRYLCLAYAMAGLAVLDKGPVGLVLPGIILLVYLIGQKQWKQLRLLFHPWGLFVFAIVALPWYLYMYHAHGMDFVEGFFGLHNYIRATISEHPEDNVWYYYIVIWLLGTMPWGPLVGYGLWKAPKNNVYRYALTWSLVTILFYSMMATKYMTYTYISLIGFSVIAAMGLEEIWSGNVALRRRRYGLLVFGEVLLLAIILVAPVGNSCRTIMKRLMNSRSGAELANAYTMKQSGDVYFYGKFSASYVYYSGHSAMLLTYGNKPITDVWAIGETVMPSEHPAKLLTDIYAGAYNAEHPAYIYVCTGDVAHFKQYVPEGRCKEVQRLGKNWVLYKAY